MWIVVARLSETLTSRSCEFVTVIATPFGLTPTFALQPGLQPPLFVLQMSTPVNPMNGTLKPNEFEPTQKPGASCWLSIAGRSDVSFVKPCGVTRICAPPSTVCVFGNPPAGSGCDAPHAPHPPMFPQAPIAKTKSADNT